MSAAVWSEPPQDLHDRLGGKVNISRAELPGREPQKVRLRLVAWGESESGVQIAIHQAGLGAWRIDWEFTDIQRHTAVPCPIDQQDGAAVATGAGYGWAYAVYPER